MNFPGGAGQSPGQQQSLAAPGGPVPVPVPGPSGPQPGGPPPPQFGLSNSAAIRAEIGRFESVHPNIYAIYDLIERVEDLALQSQIREHVISIEVQLGESQWALGEDCAVPIPMELLQLSLVCASADSCAGSPEVTGDTI
ncbi:hypothetical protein HGM15179_014460 [Zosterops borbonicus]|uniref:Arf-GAP with GTPase, ANK repeat and PH domain-containing protein 3 n=1 Tax=Zosterops borbonicus TaxID=364589 RepID=A0A8K1LGB9_9PASS|nr:hypothetical protein HGM15179_014460 [Zosterops borbonicus]